MPVAGYDKVALNHGLLLDLPFDEAMGTIAHDRAKPHHELTLSGTPTWTQLASGLTVMEFGGGDFLECPAASCTDLDFTTGDFTLAAWIKFTGSLSDIIVCRGLFDADGWNWLIIFAIPCVIQFQTCQAGATQYTQGDIGDAKNNWCLLGLSRSGANAIPYKNGVATTISFVGTHIDPVTSARKLHVGISDNEISYPFNGQMYRPRIWGRKLTTADWMNLFQTERHWFGV